ncbi:porin [Paraburkholderia sp. J67]|uniref:porin n=1 Tax=Paraburkholderia sp. J67 TaxID=2805435 RepID=UPI002ABD2965|nr:porin [Paraburkholderia sp. J67]
MKVKHSCLKLTTCLATFAISTTGHADSGVTLYGVIDTGIMYSSKTADDTTGANTGKQFAMVGAGLVPSVFGLTGNEDLGGGLNASFKLESGVSAANGGFADCNGYLFGCQAWVALGGQFGTVKAGLQYSPFFLALYASDPRSFTLFGSSLVNMVDNVLATGIYNANAVSYASPVFGGLQASVMYALGGKGGDFQAGRQYSASLSYTHGGLMINAAIYDGNSGGTVQTPFPSTQAFLGRTIGAAYKFGMLTAKLAFVNYKTAASFNNNVYSGGLDYLITPTIAVNGGVWITSDRNHTSNHSVMGAVGGEYFLSKRTTLYAQIGAVDNHGAMNTGLSINGPLYGVEGTTVASMIGMRHSF